MQYKESIQKEWLKFEQNPLDLLQQAKDLLTKQEWYKRTVRFMTLT